MLFFCVSCSQSDSVILLAMLQSFILASVLVSTVICSDQLGDSSVIQIIAARNKAPRNYQRVKKIPKNPWPLGNEAVPHAETVNRSNGESRASSHWPWLPLESWDSYWKKSDDQ